MKAAREIFGSAGPLVILAHGWGQSAESMRPLAERLSERCQAVTIDFPGHGRSRDIASDYTFSDFASSIGEIARDLVGVDGRFHLIGWSMGGSIAAKYAMALESLRSLESMILIASTPRFVAARGKNGEGQPRASVTKMARMIDSDHESGLRSFIGSLFASGERIASDKIELIERHLLGRAFFPPKKEALLKTLEELAATDLTKLDPSLIYKGPLLLIHGAIDRITPIGAQRLWRRLFPHSLIRTIKGVGHAPHLTALDQVVELINSFIFGTEEPAPIAPDTRASARKAFDRSADRYDRHADFQAISARRLLETIKRSFSADPARPKRALDLGAGSGLLARELIESGLIAKSSIIGLDFAFRMTSRAKNSLGIEMVQAEAERIPFPERSFDLIGSNLMEQWVAPESKKTLYREIARVLTRDGRLFLSTLGPGTLSELKSATLKMAREFGLEITLEDFVQFTASADLLDAINSLPQMMLESSESELITVEYPSARALLDRLKGLGALSKPILAREGFGARTPTRRLMEIYDTEHSSEGGSIKASYELITLMARKAR